MVLAEAHLLSFDGFDRSLIAGPWMSALRIEAARRNSGDCYAAYAMLWCP